MAREQERVRLGVTLLNEKGYPDWKDTIDLSLLDMCSSANGLLEQLYDSYAEGLHALGLDHADGYEYGFDIRYEGSDEQNISRWKRLTEAWKTVLKEVRVKP